MTLACPFPFPSRSPVSLTADVVPAKQKIISGNVDSTR
ncbi:hypothetical protein J2853_009701 [Streptosporangium lutulentum]|uniref:Uncharacterized protein n=1 Tax=Streptosporangium lutulentum TaxID=1461250 RepID=A0ABT9QUG5_9ACTN|nr:hypothetical protein [Streptosporangium lutulentum]